MSIAHQFQKASTVKEHVLSADVESLISHTRLDTPEYRSRLRTVSPARQLKQAFADLREVRSVESFSVDSIEVPAGRRPVRDDAVERLLASMRSIGLRTPISVRYYDERPPHIPGSGDAVILMTGAHRLEAAKRLGWETIECFVYTEGDDVDAQLWEIAENLHRAELTALERDEQIALWVELTADKARQLDEPLPGGVQPNEKGQAKAARELGISEPDARRAVKVASLSDEAKEAAREAGLDDNRTALLEAAKHSTPEDQAAALVARKAERQAKQVENDALREQHRAALPDAIRDIEARKQHAIAARREAASAEQDADRIAELEEAVRVLEAEVEALRYENKLYGEMRVQFEQGGFDKVIAGKDEEIRVLKTRLYRESEDKASWMSSAKVWRKRAEEHGYSPNVEIDIETGEIING